MTGDLYRAVGTHDLRRDAFFSSRTPDDTVAWGIDPIVIDGAGHDLMLESRGPEAASIVLRWADDRFAEAVA